MISIDAVRAAVLSDEPWTRLDELVRAELASGRTTKQIFDNLRTLAKEVQGTPGLSEDGEDALGDTLDALVGFCSAKYAYHNPPILPSEEEITELPRWARVAFAARCARRVLPLYSLFRPPASEPVENLNPSRAVIEAEQSAAEAMPGLKAEYAYEAAASGSYIDQDPRDEAAYSAANAAAYAAIDATTNERPVRAFVAMNHAAQAATPLGEIRGVIRRDFDHLARLAQWQRWTDDTPVPHEVFGPLWPEGPPPGWPADPDLSQRTELPLAFLAREGALPRVLEDEVVNLFNALNRYYILRTGDRLTVDGDIHTLLAALHPAGVS